MVRLCLPTKEQKYWPDIGSHLSSDFEPASNFQNGASNIWVCNNISHLDILFLLLALKEEYGMVWFGLCGIYRVSGMWVGMTKNKCVECGMTTGWLEVGDCWEWPPLLEMQLILTRNRIFGIFCWYFKICFYSFFYNLVTDYWRWEMVEGGLDAQPCTLILLIFGISCCWYLESFVGTIIHRLKGGYRKQNLFFHWTPWP